MKKKKKIFWQECLILVYDDNFTIYHSYVLTAANCVTGSERDFPPNGEVYPNKTHVWIGVHDRIQDRGGTTRAR